MAKFYGKIGYGITTETPADSGKWVESITEKYYKGDISKMNRRFETSNNVNDDLNIGLVISIVADPFAMNNFTDMRYVEWQSKKWKISNIDVDYPRLSLTINGVYNGGTDGD